MIQIVKRFGKLFGPGIITGASDDDASGILTYIQSGVSLGLHALWIALVSLPLMYGIQEMCARIGYVTGKGLVTLLKSNFSRWFVAILVYTSVGVIGINIGADLLAMSVVLEKLIPVSRMIWIPILATIILSSVIFFSYARFARILKWLSLSLFFYVAVAFFVVTDWKQAFIHTIIPTLPTSKESFFLLAAIIGTTISPYLFFWQTSEEREERAKKLSIHHKMCVPNAGTLRVIRKDTFIGMLFSNLIMWFVLLTAHELAIKHGIQTITSFDEAALVLQPLLGPWAYGAFSIGIIGVGFLAIPVLAGSVGYMLAEFFGWHEGLNKKFHEAHGFYWSIIGAVCIGCGVVLARIDPIQLLIGAAALYAIITPILIAVILRIANKKSVMGSYCNTIWENSLVGATLLATICAAVFCIIAFL